MAHSSFQLKFRNIPFSRKPLPSFLPTLSHPTLLSQVISSSVLAKNRRKKKDDIIILSFSLPSSLDVQQKNPGKVFNGPSIQSPCLLSISTHSAQSLHSCNRPSDLPPSETCMQVRKQQLELDIEQQTGSK